jgi:zinc protease
MKIIQCFCCAALALLATTTIRAQQKQIANQLPVSPEVRIGKLANGLTYYIRHNEEPKNRAELRLVVNAGSILETNKQVGLAHFVEHMAFNGTTHFRKNELVNFLEKSGVNFGADLNAYTSFDETVYELQVPTDSPLVYKQGIQILEDWAHGVSFEHEEIEKERGVVREEWRLGRGADARLRDQYFPVLLQGSQYAKRLPIGTRENIDTAHDAEIKSFYRDWYRPDLQAVIIVGDVDVAEAEKMIISHFRSIPKASDPKKRVRYSIPAHSTTRTAILTDPEQPYNVVQIYYLQPTLPAIKTEQQYRSDIVRGLFNQMMSSRLDELAQKPNAPFLFGNSSFGDFMGDRDAFSLLAVAKAGKDIQPAIKALVTENERVRRFGFQQAELERAKQNLLSRVENEYRERNKTKSAELVQELVQHYLKGEAIPGMEKEYELHRKFVPGIALREVNALVDEWEKSTDRAVVITAPEKEKAFLPTAAAVQAQLKTPLANLTPYVDKVSHSPLLPQAPVAGSVVSEKNFPAIGTVEWVLSNGAHVILKPTNFKNDEIEFSGISWGGSSLYNDADYQNAANAALLVSIGGMGTMDIQTLQKFLSGKNFFVSPSIAAYMQGINGRSTANDLPAAFEMLYGTFMAPRKDPQMFEVVKEQLRAQLQNRDKDPSTVFADSVGYIMSNYHPRRKPFTLPDIGKLDLDRSFEIYKERFGNAGQFYFTFVGNFNIDSIKPLVEKYVASLPGNNKKETYRDIGMRYPKGRIEKTFFRGKENKASVRLFFTGNAPYSEPEDRQLNQLCRALSIRLREVLREDAGGVYGVGVNGGMNREPESNYSIGIQFGCAPENVEKLIGLVMAEINQAKENGVARDNVDKVIAEQTRAMENDVKENSFWRFRLEQQFFRGNDPADILSAATKIRDFTVERSREIARKYFDESNLVRLVLMPEQKQ